MNEAFINGFFDEFEKIAKKRKKRKKGGILKPVIHGAYGAGLGALATLLGMPFTYKAYRMPSAGRPGLSRREALNRALLGVGQRASYGTALGAAGGWMGYNVFGKRRKKKE